MKYIPIVQKLRHLDDYIDDSGYIFQLSGKRGIPFIYVWGKEIASHLPRAKRDITSLDFYTVADSCLRKLLCEKMSLSLGNKDEGWDKWLLSRCDELYSELKGKILDIANAVYSGDEKFIKEVGTICESYSIKI
jgi:hypothetical protein